MNELKLASELIREGEGQRLTVYKDTVDKNTIGYGRNLDDKGLSYPEAELLLANDVLEARSELHTQFSFFRDLSEARKAVLMDMYHNMGLERLLTFRKMLSALRIKDYDEAAEQIKDSKYWNQVGDRAKRNYCMMRFDQPYTKQEAKSHFINQ